MIEQPLGADDLVEHAALQAERDRPVPRREYQLLSRRRHDG
ncbi:hypothetical protein QPX96_06050 [Limosilactobacillus fermentum]|nr:hypothetical protein [Limosilactobacillus fermentum]